MGERTCQFCTFGNAVVGLPDGFLVCDYPGAGERYYTATSLSDYCDNFIRSDIAGVSGRCGPGTGLIPVKGGPFAIVDAADYDKLSQYQWYAKHTLTTCYAVAKHKGKQLYMHRLIIEAPAGLLVDHIDRNGMNNKRKNLRLCTTEQNRYNSRPRKGCTSRYKGVAWNTEKLKFRAAITYDQKHYHLGYFADEEEAARAYDKKANELFGKFAYLNFPEEIRGQDGPGSSHEATGTRHEAIVNSTHQITNPRKFLVPSQYALYHLQSTIHYPLSTKHLPHKHLQ